MRLRSARTSRTARLLIGAGALALVVSGCAITRVSVSSSGTEADQPSSVLRVSDDGRYSLIASAATNLVANDTNGAPDLFRHDTKTGATVRADVAPNGGQLTAGVFSGVMSSDGRSVAFITGQALDPADTNGVADVYVRDLTSGTTTWASQPPPGGFPSGGAVQDFTALAISTGGRFVSFFWQSPGSDPDLPTKTLYRRDRQLATTTKINDGGSYQGFIASSDAHHYVLTIACTHGCTPAPVLVDADGSATGWPSLAFSCGFDSVAAISSTGRFLAWNSNSGFPSPCLPTGGYVVDRTTGAATRVGPEGGAGISTDGKTLLLLADGTLTPGGTAGRTDLYLHDVPSNTNTRFVNSTSGGEQNADIDSATLSDDAHEIGFATAASDLVDGDANAVADAFVRPGLVRPAS
jgi:Tol biopolymer transport system component